MTNLRPDDNFSKLPYQAPTFLKGRFIRRQDLFPIINTPVKISLSKLETHIPHLWSHEWFGGNTSTWYLQVLLQAVLNTSDGDVPEMTWMHLLEF